MSAPSLVAFKSINKGTYYLGNVDDTAESVAMRFLAFTVDDVLDPLARFRLEYVEDGLVQIRSCLSNKLWSRPSSNENWIVTSSNEQVNDKSNWRCTLFKPNIEGNTVTFTHVQLQSKLILKRPDDESPEYLCVDSGVSSIEPVKATFIDLTSMVRLPTFVKLIAETDDMFLGVSEGTTQTLVTFLTDDPLRISTLFEVIHNFDGSVCFKSVESGKLWGVCETTDSRVVVEGGNNQENVESPKYRFNPIRVATVVCLQSVLNSKYCKRSQGRNKQESLGFESCSLEDGVKMRVVEPVTTRTIQVTRLRTEDFIFLSNTYHTVDTRTMDNDQMVEFKSEALETLEWSKSVSMVTDLSFSIRSPTPYYYLARNCFIASGKIYKNDDYKWGTKERLSFPVTQRIPIMLPPGMPRIMVRLRARSIRFQIPFDYTQTDTIEHTGETKTYTNLRDGVYTGEFYSDFYVEAENEGLV